MRIGILGGSFDPPHRGHLHLARAALRHVPLDLVRLLVAHHPPHKPESRLTCAGHRLRMCELLARMDARIVVDDQELRRPGKSYTIDSVKALKAELGGRAELCFLIGSDSLVELSTWHRAAELIELIDFVTVARDERSVAEALDSLAAEWPKPVLDRLRALALPDPPLPLSSTELRAALARGETPAEALPASLARYIRRHGLYRAAGSDDVPTGECRASPRGAGPR